MTVLGYLSPKGKNTLKLKEAKTLGVPIISKEEFLLMLEPGPRASRAAR